MLCLKPSPHSIADVEERVRTTFPTPIDKWALEDARDALDRYKRRNGQLVLPFERVHQMLQKVRISIIYKVDYMFQFFDKNNTSKFSFGVKIGKKLIDFKWHLCFIDVHQLKVLNTRIPF